MKHKRSLSALISAALLAWTAFASPTYAKTFVYVSNAEDGDIDSYAMNEATGDLTSIGKAAAGKAVMPMTVSPNKKYLYAVVRSAPFSVITYEISASGALVQKATAPLPDSMAYACTDNTGRFLFTASYGGNKVAVSPIESSGFIEKPASQIIPTGKNAHSIRSDASNQFVFATNLGSSQVLQFKLDAASGTLTPNEPAPVKVQAGNGPRHIIFSPDGKFMYVLSELSGNVIQLAVDPKLGTLSEVSYTGTVPADAGLVPSVEGETRPKIWAADIRMTPNGKFMYATERTGSKIALLRLDVASGKPTYVTHFSTETQPRGIQIDPSGNFLIASGEKSDRISVYKIDSSNGALSLTGRFPVGKAANWVEIVRLP